jgi:DNA-binding NarL/FixJ family response regulator
MLPRARFYRGTYALQEALHGYKSVDDEAFKAGMASYVQRKTKNTKHKTKSPAPRQNSLHCSFATLPNPTSYIRHPTSQIPHLTSTIAFSLDTLPITSIIFIKPASFSRGFSVVGKRSANNLILIVDDNVFAREGMAIYLKRKGFTTKEAGDTATALDLADRHSFIAAIVDIVMPAFPGGEAQISRSEGIRLARLLKKKYPQMGVLVFSAFNDRGSEVLDLAVDGTRGLAYMVKGIHPDRVLQALQEARSGQVLLGQEVFNFANQLAREMWDRLSEDEAPWVIQAVAHFHELTDRECEVARLLAASRTTQGIATALDISTKTVEKHTNHIYNKLHLNDVDQLDPPLRKALLLAKVCWLSELDGKR